MGETLPIELRQKNWTRRGEGSCFFASLAMVANKQGFENVASSLRSLCGGAASWYSAARNPIVNRHPYAYTFDGDSSFLEWCSRERRGAAIQWNTYHMIYFDRFENGQAILIDNNFPDRPFVVEKQEFLRRWRRDGWAATFVFPQGSMPYPLYTQR